MRRKLPSFFLNISHDYYLCPVRSTRRAHTRDSYRHQHLSLPSPIRLSLGVTHLNALLSTSLEKKPVILADKSSDVISRRQQISRRLNISQEGGCSAISLCLTIYVYFASGSLTHKVVLLDKMYIMDLSFYHKEDNM